MKPQESVNEISGAFMEPMVPIIIAFVLLLALKLVLGKIFLSKIAKNERRHPRRRQR